MLLSKASFANRDVVQYFSNKLETCYPLTLFRKFQRCVSATNITGTLHDSELKVILLSLLYNHLNSKI